MCSDRSSACTGAWSGFKGSVRAEAGTSHFTIRLWDATDVLEAVFAHYPRLSPELRSRLPLVRAWALATTEGP